MLVKRMTGVAATLAMMFCSVSVQTTQIVTAAESGMRDMTTAEIVRDMGLGINLGNTFESCGDWIAQWGDGTPASYETAWGSPVITKDMIQGMANEGFGAVRVPVAWSNLLGDGYKISDAYDARVHEVVDWIIDSDMYCIINIHWDGGWVNNFPDNKEESMKRYEIMWDQIAESFKDYDDHLIFESQNEELGWDTLWNKWGGTDGKSDSYALVNEINQKFVDTVRKTGGNNSERHLLISGYNTDINCTCDPYFKMPNDPAGRMAVSVHYYTPAGFAILEDKDESWAKARSTWGTSDDLKELNDNMDMMKKAFVDKGIPVIIGEYGCPTKGKEKASVRLFISSVCKAAYDRQMCPVLWATPGGHYNRDTCKLDDQQLKAELNEIVGFKADQPKTTTASTTTSTTTATTTTTTTTTTTVTVPTTVTTEPANKNLGDANGDGKVDISDAVLIMQYLANSEKYPISSGNIANSDCVDVPDGITALDALAIQMLEAKTISPEDLPTTAEILQSLQ